MYKQLVLLFLIIANTENIFAQLPLFDQHKINTVQIVIPQDSLDKIYATLDNDYYYAQCIYTNGIQADTIDSVGFRLRGNTSLQSAKKSFKISFDKYVLDREFKGVRKLNLIGNHNDPSMIRERLFNYCWQKADQPIRRFSFVKVYINTTFMGLYTNAEEVDKQWLKDIFNNDAGNLYKCSWGADLSDLGSSQSAYKNLGGANRVYDLQTNESLDDYSDLVTLIKTINNMNTGFTYLSYLDTIFDYKNYLKSFALDVATGNWDSYAWNKNNYLLYHDSITKKFRFITFDTDNTFGVDWSGIDWATRNPYTWYHDTEPRPLIKKLLSIPFTNNLFTKYLDSISTYITHPDSIFSVIDTYKNFIAAVVPLDSFYSLDYGYINASFNASFISTVDAHTPYGIKPFLEKRKQNFAPLNLISENKTSIRIYPNPCNDYLYINHAKDKWLRLYDMQGALVMEVYMKYENCRLDVSKLYNGLYVLKVEHESIKVEIFN